MTLCLVLRPLTIDKQQAFVNEAGLLTHSDVYTDTQRRHGHNVEPVFGRIVERDFSTTTNELHRSQQNPLPDKPLL